MTFHVKIPQLTAKPKFAAVAEGDGDRLPGLRQPVDKMAEATWRRRGNTDLFSGLKKAEVVRLYPENDHIWECQLLDQVPDDIIVIVQPVLTLYNL